MEEQCGNGYQNGVMTVPFLLQVNGVTIDILLLCLAVMADAYKLAVLMGCYPSYYL